jgi:DNA-binding transcriptional regulator YiaG
MSKKQIKPAAFKERLVKALGDEAEKEFSDAINVNITTVWRWCRGDVAVPDYAVAILEFLEMLPKAMRPERWVKE